MTIRMLHPDDSAEWWAMRAELYGGAPEETRDSPHDFMGGDEVAFVHEREGGGLGGFAEVSIRRFADGCATSPVGYLEGWYVVPDLRQRGVGADLLAAAEDWVRSRGCSDIGSDTYLANGLSRAVHAAVGFREAEEAVHFAKQLEVSEGADEGPGMGATVHLRDVTDDNVHDVLNLRVRHDQRSFVAPNEVSLAQAFATTKVWVKAIYADDVPVGFAMLSDDDEKPRYYLWRFMIDRIYQGRGFGRAAMDLIEDYVRTRPGGDRVYLSYVPAPGGPHEFYTSCGYEDTGREGGGELEMVKLLDG